MPVLNNFLCCCQLETGAVIIGWTGLVLDTVSIAGNSAALAELNSSYPPIIVSAMKVPLAIILACTLISSFANILLLWGTNARNQLFLLPWLTVKMLNMVCIFISLFVLGVVMADQGGAAGIFITAFIITGIILYKWLCILSLFQELREVDDHVISSAPPAAWNLPPYSVLRQPC